MFEFARFAVALAAFPVTLLSDVLHRRKDREWQRRYDAAHIDRTSGL